MNTICKMLLVSTALSAFAVSTAYAAGTTAGTVVTNTFTLNYSVNTVAQTAITPAANTEFTVDRRIDLVTAAPADAPGNPNQTDVPIEFTFTNEGNDEANFVFTAVDNGGDATLENVRLQSYWLDTNVNGTQDGTEPTLTYTAGTELLLNPDVVVHINTLVDIEAAATNGQSGTLLFTARATDGSGTTLTTSPTNTLAGEEIYVDDDSGETDAVRDSIHTALATLTINAATITVEKTAAVVSTDGTGCTAFTTTADTAANFAVPGACVEYVITVENATGSATATAINITDTLADELVLMAQTSDVLGGSFASPTIPSGGLQCDGTNTTCNLAYTGGSLAGGQTGTITIRALVEANP